MGTPNVDNVQLGRGADGAGRPSSRPGALRRLGLPAAALGLALGAAQVAAAAPSLAAAQSGSVAVGHAPALPKGAVSATAPAASQKLSLDIQLNTGHAAALAQYASAVANRNSPYYHQYLTPAQIAQYFGASQTEISAVEASLRAQGLTVGSVSADGMFVSASGTVAQVSHAFNVTINGYKAGGRSFYANTTAPTVPVSVSSDISGITGMDTVGYAVPHLASAAHAVKASSAKANTSVTANYSNNSCSGIAQAYSGSGLSNGSGYYTDDSISSIYGLNKMLANGNDGAGVTVAVYELETYDATGVSLLDSCYGHSTSVSEVKVDGGPTTGTANAANNIGVESALDIQNIANLAPGVQILDYAAPNTDAGILDNYAAIINQDKAKVVSSSWGLCEVGQTSSVITGENTLFQEAAAQGQTVLAAAGDNGDTDCYGFNQSTALGVDDPASQQYVTGVGGTGMTGLGSPTPTVWNSNWSNGNGGTSYGAGGGGVSSTWSLPSWQSSVQATGYSTNCTTTVSQGGTGCREVPDVSALADPNNGYVIEEYYAAGTANGEYYFTIGGTSGAAPVWAAVVALADASTQCRLNGEAGFINPSLYTAGEGSSASSVYTDVTSGTNGIAAYSPSYSYPAGTGYDMASGWGTPVASGVAANVCQTPITSAGSYYQADGPIRLMDTRSGSFHVGSVTGPVKANAGVKLSIVGNSLLTGTSAVPSGATAVVLNVTATQPTAGGNATVYPDGEAMPLTSNLNYTAGNTVPNLVVVPLKSDGAVDIANNSPGTVQFIADLEGYYTTSTSVNGVVSSGYNPISPLRALDTRSGGNGVAKAKIAALTGVSLQLGGATITPIGGGSAVMIPSGITGVAMNVTVTNATGGGFLTVYPTQTASGSTVTLPNVSNLNYSTGQTVPNMVMVPVGKDGKVRFYNGAISGATDVIADIAGYYTASATAPTGEVYHPLGPVRLVDTRIGEGETSVSPIGAKGTLNLALPSSYEAVIANVTVTSPAGGGFLTAYPLGTTRPAQASNLNFSTGQTVPNLAIVRNNSGVSFYNDASANVQLIVDLSGYFSAS